MAGQNKTDKKWLAVCRKFWTRLCTWECYALQFQVLLRRRLLACRSLARLLVSADRLLLHGLLSEQCLVARLHEVPQVVAGFDLSHPQQAAVWPSGRLAIQPALRPATSGRPSAHPDLGCRPASPLILAGHLLSGCPCRAGLSGWPPPAGYLTGGGPGRLWPVHIRRIHRTGNPVSRFVGEPKSFRGKPALIHVNLLESNPLKSKLVVRGLTVAGQAGGLAGCMACRPTCARA